MMIRSLSFGVVLLLLAAPGFAQKPTKHAETYAAAIRKINETHARKPGDRTEDELAKKVPKRALQALEALLDSPDGAADLTDALVACAEAALDLDRSQDFEKILARLKRESPKTAETLGTAYSTKRFQLRGIGGLDEEYLERFASIFSAILDGYAELFGDWEWSKVPGKKLRVRIHLEDKITRPPHFAPQYPFHSEIDFPVIDPEALRSPTSDGKFLFYGLCHELGHVIAMWGDRSNEEDHHTWAHYTGVALVEHLKRKLDIDFGETSADGLFKSPVGKQEPAVAQRPFRCAVGSSAGPYRKAGRDQP